MLMMTMKKRVKLNKKRRKSKSKKMRTRTPPLLVFHKKISRLMKLKRSVMNVVNSMIPKRRLVSTLLISKALVRRWRTVKDKSTKIWVTLKKKSVTSKKKRCPNLINSKSLSYSRSNRSKT